MSLRSFDLASSLRILLVLFLVSSLIGCTSMQVVQGNNLPSALSSLKAGDTVNVVTYSGTATTLLVSSVDGRTLSGQSDGKAVSIPVVQIKSIEAKQFSAGKSMGLAAGVGLTIFVVAVAVGVYAIAHAFD
jgi:hypothetical protein